MSVPSFFKSKKGKFLLGLVLLIVALRIALPNILLHFANKTLSEMDGYRGHINDIDVALYRGAYVIDSFYLNKLDLKTENTTPFLAARAIDLSLEWKAIFKGRLVGELVFEQPDIRFTEDKVELKDVAQDTADFRELLNDFMPIEVNKCEIRDGSLRYVDNTQSPKIDIAITHMNGLATNLRNAYETGEILPASIDATGTVYGGRMNFSMKLNPLAVQPTFDLNTTVEKTELVQLNDMFKAYGNFDVNKGEFNMYAEAATKDGRFRGYVKPIIKNLDVVEWKGQDRKDGFFHKIYESVVGGASQLLENPKKEQVATKINFSGSIDQPQMNVLESILLVLQNAFVVALKPSIDNQINLSKLAKADEEEKRGLLKRLFKSKDRKKKKE